MSFSTGGRWLLYFNTVRYLKPSQVLWRLWRQVPVFPVAGTRPAPALRRSDQAFAAFPRKKQSLLGPDAFRFLNLEGRIEGAADWNDPQREALWLYNLHYFDDLCAEGAQARRAWHGALIARWIAENPVGRGIGWDPYPTSLRIVNWIKWSLAGGDLGDAARQSLALQARHLARRVEWQLLGNHLLANAKALVFAGAYFDGAEAQSWLKQGCGILAGQLDEQILPDGGHFERSPMYHAIVLEDQLDLLNLSRCHPGALPEALVAALRAGARRMLRWARAMAHPDGGIAFFNDAAMGMAPGVAELERYAEALGVAERQDKVGAPEALVELRASGYTRLELGPAVVIFDAAPVGPDYLPGHAHADTLSFELSWAGGRVIGNSGTSRYGTGPERLWERSTAAHNTLEIDGENSSEVWSGFRVARRAYPVGYSAGRWSMPALPGVGARVACAHDGYTRLRGRPVHRRTLELSEQGLRWTDEVTGSGTHRVVGRIPLHPDVSAQRTADGAWRLALASGLKLLLALEGGSMQLEEEEGRYSPEFGRTLKRRVLRWTYSGELPVSVALFLRPASD